MGEFFPNQRYISDGEPELGISILKLKLATVLTH